MTSLSRRAVSQHCFRPAVRQLESRLTPATFTVTSLANSGAGSLRQAVIDANGAAGADIIQFDSKVFAAPRTIKLTSGELSITGPLSINGPTGKVTISGNNSSRIFNTSLAGYLTAISFSNVTLTAAFTTADGGALRGEGQAIAMTNCKIHGNSGNFAGGVYLRGTDLDYDGGKFTAIDCEFSANAGHTAALGVFGEGSMTTLLRTTFSGNTSDSSVAAIFIDGGINIPGSLLIEDCTIIGNSASGDGGGIKITGDFAANQLTIRNTTISGNTAANHSGIFMDGVEGTLRVQNSTIAFNTATGKGGGIGLIDTFGSVAVIALESSIVGKNSAANGPDVLTPNIVTYQNSSLYSSTGIATLTNLGGNRPFGEDPLLSPLADNGGPTKTHALAFSSSVVNKGSNPANLAFDQRGTGNPRNFYGGVDIGAFEVNTLKVDTTVDEFDGDYSAGDLSLREAISLTAFPAVHFDPDVFSTPQTITLTMGVFAIPGGRTIIGPAGKVTINGNNASRIFNVTPTGPNVTNHFSNLILTGGNAGTGSGGAIYGQGFGFPGLSVTLNNCTLTGNTATTGGAISIASGKLTIEDCTLTNNTANGLGGGGGGGAISATFTGMKTFIRRSTISGNTAASLGGGVFIYGSTYQGGISLIEDCTISNNNTPQEGGGLALQGNANTIRNSTISGNTAGRGGGIALVIGGTAVIQNSTIAYNTATFTFGAGGGISGSVALPQIFLESSIVSKNSAPNGQGPDISAGGTVTHKTSSIFSSAGISAFNDLGGNRPFGEEPMLAPLTYNGGPTFTHNLQVGSPLIDKGSNPVPLADDQRGFGFDRISGPAADIGALEVIVPALIPAFPESVTLSDYSPQRSRVTHWYITFAGTPILPMNPADAFQVERQSDGALVQFTVTTVASDVQLNFTGGPLLGGSLEDGRYTVRIFAAQIPNLDANDDGLVGDDYILVGNTTNKLFRLFGDADGDGDVDNNDFITFRSAFGTGPSIFDADGDGDTDNADFGAFRNRFGTTLP